MLHSLASVLLLAASLYAQILSREEFRSKLAQATEAKRLGRLDEYIRLLEEVLPTAEAVAQGGNEELLRSFQGELGSSYLQTQQFAKAKGIFEKERREMAAAGDSKSREYIAITNYLASSTEGLGNYDTAADLMSEAVKLDEALIKSNGRPAGADLASLLTNLGYINFERGREVDAEESYSRAAAIFKSLPAGEESIWGPAYAQLMDDLGQLYVTRFDYVNAEDAYRKAQETAKRWPDERLQLAVIDNDFGLLELFKEELPEAQKLLTDSLSIKDELGIPRETATTRHNLGILYLMQRQYDKAKTEFSQALEMRRASLPPDHPDIAQSLLNLSSVETVMGSYDQAAKHAQESLETYRRGLGPTHPSVVPPLLNLASISERKGDIPAGIQYERTAADIRERNISMITSLGSEDQKVKYLRMLSVESYSAVSLNADSAPENRAATDLALTTVLRRKGRVLDALTGEMEHLRSQLSDESDRALLNELGNAGSRLAALVFQPRGANTPEERDAELNLAQSRFDELERQVSLRTAGRGLPTHAVEIAEVQNRIPADAALIEYVLYEPAVPTRGSRASNRYAVYLLRHTGNPELAPIDSDAAAIDADVSQFRAALRNPRSHVIPPAQRLEEKIFKPVRQRLGAIRHVIVSADAALNLIPFGALADEKGKYLAAKYDFTYVNSGRDLLPRAVRAPRSGVVIVADPAYDQAGAAAPSKPSATRGDGAVPDLSNLKFDRLPETFTVEAAAIKKAVPSARVLHGADATEAALRGLRAPEILHMATHGFFQPDRPDPARRYAAFGFVDSVFTQPGLGVNPLLRSGLWLAGANTRNGGAGDDGILTALEVAQLDLAGTDLVTLSACETGVGEVNVGEGMYGLRRAIFIAGAKSALVTLWKVDSSATADFMGHYYRLLLGTHKGRADSLITAQREWLNGDGARKHPYYWASFILLGETGALK